MGRKKTYVAATTVKLLADTPNITKDSVVAGAIGGDRKTFCMDKILENYHNSVAIQAGNYFKYGKTKYVSGLPQGSMDLGKGDDLAVKAVLDAMEGEPVTIVSNVLDYFKPEPLAYMHMQANWGWDPDTHVLASPPFTPAAHDSVFTYKQALYIGNNTLKIYIEETWFVGARKQTRTVDVPIAPFQQTDVWYFVIYQKAAGQDQYWVYNEATGVHPSLAHPEGLQLSSPFYPIVPLRLDNQDMSAAELKDTPLYRGSRALLRKFDIHIDELCANIHENPDIGDVDHAFVMMGVNLQEESQVAIRYLADFFLYLGQISTTTKEAYDAWTLPDDYDAEVGLRPGEYPPGNLLTIEDTKFKIELHYNYINTKVLDGNIGKIGFATRECVIRPVNDYTTYQKEDSHVILRKQVTADQYVEITVSGLLHKNYVYKNHTVDTNVEDSLKEDENNFIIPLHHKIVKALPLTMETQLIYDSFQLLFNSYEIVKLKWYQTGFFQILVVVVAVVISIYTGYWNTLVSALSAANGVVAVATIIAKQLLLAYAFSAGFSLLAQLIGVEAAMILAIVAMAVGVTKALDKSSFVGLPSAEALLATSQALSSGAQDVIQDEFKELLDEVEQFEKMRDEMDEELEEIWDELNGPRELDPFHFVGLVPQIFPGETPDQFYFRTVHAGNVGVFSLDAIDNYVENAVRLPSTDETLA